MTTRSSLALVAAGMIAAALPAHAQQQQPGSQQQPAQIQQQGEQSQLNQQEIRQVQTQLKQMGLYQGEVDGIVGPQTQQAVRQFQQQRGVEQTATLDRQLMQQIMDSGSSATGGGTGQSGQGGGTGQVGTGGAASPGIQVTPGGTGTTGATGNQGGQRQ